MPIKCNKGWRQKSPRSQKIIIARNLSETKVDVFRQKVSTIITKIPGPKSAKSELKFWEMKMEKEIFAALKRATDVVQKVVSDELKSNVIKIVKETKMGATKKKILINTIRNLK